MTHRPERQSQTQTSQGLARKRSNDLWSHNMGYGPWRAVLPNGTCMSTYLRHLFFSTLSPRLIKRKLSKWTWHKKLSVKGWRQEQSFPSHLLLTQDVGFFGQWSSTTASVARHWVRVLYLNQDFHEGIFVKYLVLKFVCVGYGPYQTFFQLSSLDTKWTRQFLLNEVTDSIGRDKSQISAT